MMIFPPNLTGPLHVGSAAVLWLTWREARRRGAEMWLRKDDRCVLFKESTPEQERAAIDSTMEACDLLGIGFSEVYSYSDRMDRYRGAVMDLLMSNLAVERGRDMVELFDTTFYDDPINGLCREPCNLVVYRGYPDSTITAAVDFADFNVPVHIRGVELQLEAFAEIRTGRALAAANPKYPSAVR